MIVHSHFDDEAKVANFTGGVESNRTFRLGPLVTRPDASLRNVPVCNAVEKEAVHGNHRFSSKRGHRVDAGSCGEVFCGKLELIRK